MIAITTLTKTFKNFKAVNNLNMEINNGEILGLAGLNGAGKSTTIRATAGIIFPTSGKIIVNDLDIVKDKANASKHIGWVPELPNFEPDSRPMPLLKYYAGFYGIKSEDAEKDIIELMKKFDIYAYRDCPSLLLQGKTSFSFPGNNILTFYPDMHICQIFS